MARVAIVNKETNKVENVAAVEEGAKWSAPEGRIAVPSDEAEIGMIYREGVFMRDEVGEGTGG
jgi:hypothetical protein